ncbi:MAG TPA: hypothetical protein VJ998_05695, partial [Pseudomonadales bacterium]|nr:hypothetical protein [Pseudomonadales bacterium]
MKSITLAITLLCTCTMTGEARADISAAAVVANYITALGGRDRTDAVQTIIIRGTYTEGKARFNATTARMRPYYKLVGEPGKRSPAFEEGYDGSAWEYYGQAGIVLRTVGAPSAVMRHST